MNRARVALGGFLASALGIGAVASLLKRAAAAGIGFNRTLEDARLGIAAVLKQFQPQKFGTIADAMKVSEAALESLKKKAVESPASFQQLVSGFQAITGAATGAGIAIDKQVDLVLLLSQALAGLGIRSEQLIQESRALITGNITEDAAAARILGITREQIATAKEAGTLFEFLQGKLSAFSEAGKVGAKNYSTALSNLADVVQQKIGQITLPIFEAIKSGVLSLTEAINRADLQAGLGSFADRLAGVAKGLLNLATFGVEHIRAITIAIDGLTLALGYLAASAIFRLMGPLLTRLAALRRELGAVSKVVTDISRSGGVLLGVVATLSTFAGRVGALASAFGGWQIGKVIGDLEIFGNTLNDRAYVNILRVWRAWEQLKLSLGIGSTEAFANVERTLNDFLVGPLKNTPLAGGKAGAGSSEPNKISKEKFDLARKDLQLEHELAALELERLRTVGAYVIERTEGWKAGVRTVESLEDEAEAIRDILHAQSQLLETRRMDRMEALKAGLIDEAQDRQMELEDGRASLAILKERLQLTEQLKKIEQDRAKESAEVAERLDAARQGDFISSLRENLKAFGKEFGNTAKDLADLAMSPFIGLRDGIANATEQMLLGTMTVGEGIKSIWNSVVGSIIQSFSKMVADWITTHVVMKGIASAWAGFKSLMRAKDVTEANAAEAAKTGPLATNATLASIGSFGVAVAIGVAAIAAILAGVGAFEHGGVVAGGEQIIRVNERGPESVLNARATRNLGSGLINALNAGAVGARNLEGMLASGLHSALPSSPSPTFSSAAPATSAPHTTIQVTIIAVDDRRRVLDEIQSSAGRVAVIDIVKGGKTEIGIDV